MLTTIFIGLFLIATYFCFREKISKHFSFQFQFTLEPTERLYDGEKTVIPPGGRILLIHDPIPVSNVGDKEANFTMPDYGMNKVKGKDEKILRMYE